LGAHLRYEVMYLLNAADATVPPSRKSGRDRRLIVVVGGDGLWNCHIHTNDVGAASKRRSMPDGPGTSGSPIWSSRWKRTLVRDAAAAGPGAEEETADAEDGVVAVANGEGWVGSSAPSGSTIWWPAGSR